MPKSNLQANPNDLDRLRAEYTNRVHRYSEDDRYSLFNPSRLYYIQQRNRGILRFFRKQGIRSFRGKKILELGCGSGTVLLDFLSYGAFANHLHGCDLIFDHLVQARNRLTHLPLSCADGRALPYLESTFDLVLQFTVFSSILEIEISKRIANEMIRVLKPEGMILWYDFWLNPTNPQTKGIRPKEVHDLFPNCEFDIQKITLAPPIARRTVPISWLLSTFLEKLTIFNTHYLVAICPKV